MQSKVVALFAFFIVKSKGSDVHRALHDVDYFWRDYDGTIPNDALQTGHGTYIGQIIERKADRTCAMVPGTLYPNEQVVVTMISGNPIRIDSNIKILCSRQSQRFRWEHTSTSSLDNEYLSWCLEAGHENEPVYIGKVFHENKWKIGKVFPLSSKWKGLNVWKEPNSYEIIDDFEILKFV